MNLIIYFYLKNHLMIEHGLFNLTEQSASFLQGNYNI